VIGEGTVELRMPHKVKRCKKNRQLIDY